MSSKLKYCAVTLGIAAAFPLSAAAESDRETEKEKSPKAYVVVFQDNTPFFQFRSAARADEREEADPEGWRYIERGVLGAVQRLEGMHRFKSKQVYSAALNGFAVDLTPAQLEALKSEPSVAYIEEDLPMKTTAQTLPWGINRIEADLSSTLAGNGGGTVSGVNAYVIDTGIDAHSDLNLVKHVNFAGGNNTDCNGHGTHVAGTIAAYDNTKAVVGVAPGVMLTGVKVLDCSGSGSYSSIIKGIDWVTAHAVKPAVANMSLGGGASASVDDAVRRSVQAGIFYAIAAGNSGADACNSSPARAGQNAGGVENGIVTTAATDSADREASWSNYGGCVDIWAPGVGILSTKLGGGTTTMSGTSMASPHVAGAAALYLSRNMTASPAQVATALRSNALFTGTSSKDGRAIQVLQVKSF